MHLPSRGFTWYLYLKENILTKNKLTDAGVINSLLKLVFPMHKTKYVRITWEPYVSHDLLGPNHT